MKKLKSNKWKWGFLIAFLVLSLAFVIVGIVQISFHSGYEKYTSDQMQVFIADDIFYYCDENRGAALYAYQLNTGEEVLVTKKQGAPYRTNHGCFYITDELVYEIRGLEIVPLCKCDKGQDFVDYTDGDIIWTKRNKLLQGDNESFFNQIVYRQKKAESEGVVLLSEDASEKLYDISDSTISIASVLLAGDELYIGQGNGVFCMDLQTKEIKQIFERDVLGRMYSDGEYVVFQGHKEEDGYTHYYVKSETEETHKVGMLPTGSFLLIKDGALYYESGAIFSYDLKTGTEKSLANNSMYSYQDYEMAEIYGDKMILRHGHGYYFAVLDMITGTIQRVEKETE